MPACLPLQFMRSGDGPSPARIIAWNVSTSSGNDGVLARSSSVRRPAAASKRADDGAVPIGAVVAGADQRQLLVVDAEPGVEHRRRLQRLQRRAGVDGERTDCRPAKTTSPLGVEGDHRAVVHRLVETVAVGDRDGHVPAAPVELIHDGISSTASTTVSGSSITSCRVPHSLDSA